MICYVDLLTVQSLYWDDLEAGIIMHAITAIIRVQLQCVALMTQKPSGEVHWLKGHKARKELVFTDPEGSILRKDMSISSIFILKE